MAILFWEGAEGYQSIDIQQKIAKVGTCSGVQISSLAFVRSSAKGTRSLGIISSTADNFYISTSQSTIFVEFWWASMALMGSSAMLDLTSSTGGQHFRIVVSTSGPNSLATFIDGAGTTVSTFTLYPANTWVHFGVKLVVGNSGTLTVKIDDVTIVDNVTGDFQSGASTTVDRVQFSFPSVSANSFRYDDIVIQDSSGSFLGSGVHSVASFPTSAGDSTQFTPSVGSNFQCVDETDPNDDTDYVSSSTATNLDLYQVTDLPSYTGTVLGADIWARMRKDTPGVETCKLALKTNSTVFYGSVISPGSSYAMERHLALVSPSTLVAWTQAEINALQIGAEIT